MSAEAPFTLGQYIAALIAALAAAQPAALIRMRQVVGDRRAHIALDDETVVVFFAPDGLRVEPSDSQAAVAGEGATDSATVLDLLDGRLEVTAAILDGRLRVVGSAAEIVRMFQAIEILLDASTRTPLLQALADRFRRERQTARRSAASGGQSYTWYPFASDESERALLAQLDLLL